MGLIVINHEDCGAKIANKKKFNSLIERKIKKILIIINKRYPYLKVSCTTLSLKMSLEKQAVEEFKNNNFNESLQLLKKFIETNPNSYAAAKKALRKLY